MTESELDVLWQRALHESVAAGEQFTRYRFAALVRAEVMREMADSGHSTARAGEPSTWQPFDTAPQDGEIFLALNHDREAWVATYITKEGPSRLAYRTNGLRESKRYRVHEIDGKRLMEELESSESWDSNWTYWSRGYTFKPTHWTPLPGAPRCRSLAGDQRSNVQEESAAHLPVRLLTGKEQ
jgi:hypothetical protein